MNQRETVTATWTIANPDILRPSYISFPHYIYDFFVPSFVSPCPIFIGVSERTTRIYKSNEDLALYIIQQRLVN